MVTLRLIFHDQLGCVAFLRNDDLFILSDHALIQILNVDIAAVNPLG